jgi:GNAT superfamily N-acetyltransferase
MFRFEHDNDRDELYWSVQQFPSNNSDLNTYFSYELQVKRDFHRMGLGKWLMSSLGEVGCKQRMESIVLTVFTGEVHRWSNFQADTFTENENAMAFYRSLGLVAFPRYSQSDLAGAGSKQIIHHPNMTERVIVIQRTTITMAVTIFFPSHCRSTWVN